MVTLTKCIQLLSYCSIPKPSIHSLDGNAFTGTIPPTFLKAYNGTNGETVTIGLTNNKLTGTIPETFLTFESLVLNVAGNQIEGIDSDVCYTVSTDTHNVNDPATGVVNGWMNGLVEQYGCDAILCPVDTFSDAGRQEDEDTKCQPCGSGTDGLMGATTCNDEVIIIDDDEYDDYQLKILVEFYLSLGGPQWNEDGRKGWEVFVEMESTADLTLPSYQELDIDVCNDKFHGVECDDDGKVIEISLPSNGLEGIVPSSFWDLPELKEADLSGNELRLDRDYGFGDIGNAVNLVKIDLSSNDVQKFKGIGRSTSLEELVVDDAYFFDSLDTELYQVTTLKILHMQFSGLKGKIPAGLKALTNLRAIK